MSDKWEWRTDSTGWRLYFGPIEAFVFDKRKNGGGWYRTLVRMGHEHLSHKAYRREQVAKDAILDIARKRMRELLAILEDE